MPDPLTALGLASNIVQLIQFTSDIISKSREFYQSADGSLVELLELEAITGNLHNLSAELVVPPSDKPKATKTERQLSELCLGCREISDDLLYTIRDLKLSVSPTRWKSFRQALRSVWEEDKIKDLEVRLERYRRQIDTTLLISLRESIDSLPKSDRQAERVSHLVLRPGKQVKQWQTELVDKVHQSNWERQNEKDIMHFSAKLSVSAKGERETLIKYHILERLSFYSMGDRAERIPKAYERTFNWIWDSSLWDAMPDQASSITSPFTKTNDPSKDFVSQSQWSNFSQWLQSDSSLYWITGKPGSGKSTLMKYIQHDHRTLHFLKPWIDGHHVTVLGHFFWNSGAEMQMSQLGLLQTLLYGAIKNRLDLIPTLFPQTWRSFELFGGDLREWSLTELKKAFQLLIADESMKFFIFIDGLDEFEGDGAELVTFILESITSRENVKFCVASRPWLVFEDGFQRRPSLRVEELTARDILLFITEKLHESDMFVRLDSLDHSSASRLISEVTEKASGVFLWVQLVVQSLLEGLRDGDAIADLQARVLILPADLEGLFEKILAGLNSAYFEQASMYFQIVQATEMPLTLISLSFAEEGFETAISYKIGPETSEEQDFRAERMRRRLSSRCKGLLEAPTTGIRTHQAKVQYLHRTVRDYIRTPKAWRFVASGTSESFSPDVALSAAWLRIMKAMSPRVDDLDYFWTILRSSIRHSIKWESSRPDAQILLLDEISRVGDHLFVKGGDKGSTWLQDSMFGSHWTYAESLRRGTRIHQHNETTCFLGFAFLYPLQTYVETKLRNGAPLDIQIGGHSLLYGASSYMLNFQFVELLFNLGADPNACDSTTTDLSTWKQILQMINSTQTSIKDPGQVADLIQLYIKHGADVGITVDNLTLNQLIKKRLRGWNATKTEELLSNIVAAQETMKRSKRRVWKKTESRFEMLSHQKGTEPKVVEDSKTFRWLRLWRSK